MTVTIRPTVPEEAELLASIQQAAFKPLWEAYHDEGNPYLRGAEDILCRFNEKNRCFTILCDGEIVGGVLYRVSGKRSPWDVLAEGEYYLARVYVKPELQGQHIARTAIRLCEKEFPDAVAFYVDFPEDLEKNRRCYENVGYRDTGKRICEDGAPPLAMFKKIVVKEDSI